MSVFKDFMTKRHWILAVFFAFVSPSYTNLTHANGGGGGIIIGNGGGCAELLLRASLNRNTIHARALISKSRDPENTKIFHELVEFKAEESDLIYSKEKFDTCINQNGFSIGGVCLPQGTRDNNFYISTDLLYSDSKDVPCLSRDTSHSIFAELILAKKGYPSAKIEEIRDLIRKEADSHWFESKNHKTGYYVLYTTDLLIKPDEVIVSDGKNQYTIEEIFHSNDPIAKYFDGQLEKFEVDNIRWDDETLVMNAKFWGSNKQLVRGMVRIKIYSPDSKKPGFKVSYVGLD